MLFPTLYYGYYCRENSFTSYLGNHRSRWQIKKREKIHLSPREMLTNIALPNQLEAKWCSAGKLTKRKVREVQIRLKLPQTTHKTNVETHIHNTAEKLFCFWTLFSNSTVAKKCKVDLIFILLCCVK